MENIKKRIADFIDSKESASVENDHQILGESNDDIVVFATTNNGACTNTDSASCNKSTNSGDCKNVQYYCTNSKNGGNCNNAYDPNIGELNKQCGCG